MSEGKKLSMDEYLRGLICSTQSDRLLAEPGLALALMLARMTRHDLKISDLRKLAADVRNSNGLSAKHFLSEPDKAFLEASRKAGHQKRLLQGVNAEMPNKRKRSDPCVQKISAGKLKGEPHEGSK